jgi:choline-sulfatase
MIRRGALKYVTCGDDPEQLYDLDADPHELENLASRPEHAETLADFRREVSERWDFAALRMRVLASQDQRRLVARALARGQYDAWDFELRTDASMQYVRNRADMYELQRRARLESGEEVDVAS